MLGQLFSKNSIPLQDSVIFELRSGFLMKNSIYGQMETSGDQNLNPKIRKNKSAHVFFVCRHFQSAMYKVFHCESESEVKNMLLEFNILQKN